MATIKATADVEQLSRALSELGRKQLPFALALAATRMAQRIKRAELKALNRVIDRPTKTTQNSLYVKAATKAKPEARTFFKDAWSSGIPADTYLQPQVFGGSRKAKRMEKALIAGGLMKNGQRAIPRSSVTDQHGNVKGGQVMKILSGLGAAETVRGTTANASSSKRSKRKNNRRFFVANINGASGIWERKGTAFGSGVKLWYLFVDDEPTYSKRLDFFGIAEEQVSKHYTGEFTSALDQAIATAR